jgi:hypothetical protein
MMSISQEKITSDSLGQKIKFNKSYGRIGISYSSDWVYAGRKDSLAAPYITPSVAYYHKSGLFIRGTFSYLVSPEEQRIDMYGLRGGYVYSKNDFYAGISGAAMIFNDSSYNVLSEVNGSIFTYAGYDFDWVDFSVDASLLFGESTDLMTGAEVSHTFYADRYRLKMIPAFYLMAGTQNYYFEYYKYRSSQGKGRGRGSGSGGGTTEPVITVSEYDKFRILAFELSLPVYYTIKKFRFSFTPTYVFPQSPSVATIDGIAYPEQLENTFYWNAGISYRF